MDPGQRLVLEVTYDSLYRSGLQSSDHLLSKMTPRSGMRKNTLINSTVGMYVGGSVQET